MAKTKVTPKPPRKSPGEGGYPYNPLSAGLKLGSVIKDHGGGELPKSVIAGVISMGDSSPSFYQLCASTKCWGIVEGSRALKLTDAGHDYFFPTTESAARIAMLGFMKTPTVYAHLIDRFDGKRVPGPNLLSNLVHRECAVPSSWAGRAASLFVSSLSELGLIDEGGYLRYGAALHTATRNTPTPADDQPDGAQEDAINVILRSNATTTVPTAAPLVTSTVTGNVWQYKEAGGLVRLETPDPLPKALWDRLKKYVEMLEPSSNQGGEA